MRIPHSPAVNRSHTALLPLIGILLGVYCFTYSGNIESNDTRVFFNATSSLVQYGDLFLDKTASTNPPDPTITYESYPLASAASEPFQSLLPAPLYWLATQLPGIGLVHAVWLFNIFVTIAIVVVVYVFAHTLAYQQRIALFAAISAGLLTMLWPYSKTFFREPLATLMIFLAALFLERLRRSGFRSWFSFIAAALAFTSAWLTKEAVVFALPALLIIVLPVSYVSPRIIVWTSRLVLTSILVAIIVLIAASIIVQPQNLQTVYAVTGTVLRRSPDQIATSHMALHTYLLSIGGSIWGTSPVVLLSIPGLFMLAIRRQHRYPLVILLLLLTFSFGYSILRGVHWFGGLSWPPRFLLPVIPFLIIGALPFVDYVFSRGNRILWLVITLICAFSLWVQFSGVSLRLDDYMAALPAESGGLGEWGGGLNTVAYLRWVLIPTLWGRVPFDFAWVRVNLIIWPLTCIAVVVASGCWLLWVMRTKTGLKSRRWIFIAYPIVLVALIWLGLRGIYGDDLYTGSNVSLHNLLPLVESSTKPGDVLLLSDNEYEPFFLNHGKLTHPRVISLPDPPGERPSPEASPLVVAPNPDRLLVKSTIPLIHNLADQRSTLWLLADFGQFHPWAVRPVERFMVTHYYPIRELVPEPLDPRVRLLEYSTLNAPDPYMYRGPDIMTEFQFGDSIQLLGVSLPAGLSYRAGDIVALSLYWQTLAALGQNYTVAWFIVDTTGVVVAQGADTQPAWGFAPTTSWQPNVPYWDNRALRLPPQLATGLYSMWVRLYQSDASDLRLSVRGMQVQDETIAVMPFNLTIEG